jgi:ribulose-bisphosphate carboxylase large chain
MSFSIFKDSVDREKYYTVEYYLYSRTTLRDAAWNLAIGQSVGNPNIRNSWETDELFAKNSCIILGREEALLKEKDGVVTIAFPVVNIDFATDGISHFLCNIMGGQLDIDIIEKCHVNKVVFPASVLKSFKGPRFGITGVREFTDVRNKPLLGGIVKPKIGVSPSVLLQMIKEMVEGGVNFIKEDEIMSNPKFCSIEDRLPPIAEYLKGKKVIYSVCINSDPLYILDRVKKVHQLGGNSVHINFWSGLGVYKSVRDLNLPLFLHFQKSGDKILTNKEHHFHIKWNVICYLASLMGVDTIHAGMWGAYMNEDPKELSITLDILRAGNTLPVLSCGMHPGLVGAVTHRFGKDYMANVGGALHGHPAGTRSGAAAMRQAIDGNYGEEYNQAIQKWGTVQ